MKQQLLTLQIPTSHQISLQLELQKQFGLEIETLSQTHTPDEKVMTLVVLPEHTRSYEYLTVWMNERQATGSIIHSAQVELPSNENEMVTTPLHAQKPRDEKTTQSWTFPFTLRGSIHILAPDEDTGYECAVDALDALTSSDGAVKGIVTEYRDVDAALSWPGMLL